MKIKNVMLVAMGIFGIVALVVVATVVFVIYANTPNDRTIAKSVDVTQEWTEVAIDPVVTPAKRVQEINLRIKDFREDRNSNTFDVRLPNGTVISPEIELYDEGGTKFEFHHSGFVMKTYDDVVFSPGVSALPADRRYTRMRIRSSVPFSCDQIYWRDYNPK
jgi:hypothetical protein